MSEYFRESIHTNPDLMRDITHDLLLKRLTLPKDQFTEDNMQNVIQEVNESESMVEENQFKFLDYFKTMIDNKKSQGTSPMLKEKQKEEDPRVLKSLLRFKFSKSNGKQVLPESKH